MTPKKYAPMPVFDTASGANPFRWIIEQAQRVRAERAYVNIENRARANAARRAESRSFSA